MTSDDDRPEPAAEDRVRELLAEAVPDPGPAPAWVVRRLDGALDELRAERESTPGDRGPEPERVVALGPSEDRAGSPSRSLARSWARPLVAAAAVVALGLAAGPPLLRALTSSGTSTASRATSGAAAGGGGSPDRATTPSAAVPRSGASVHGGAAGVGAQTGRPGEGVRVPGRLPTVSSRHLARAALGLRGHRSTGATRTRRRAGAPCLPAGLSSRPRVAVRLDGQPALLVYAAPEDGAQVVSAYACPAVASQRAGKPLAPEDSSSTFDVPVSRLPLAQVVVDARRRR